MNKHTIPVRSCCLFRRNWKTKLWPSPNIEMESQWQDRRNIGTFPSMIFDKSFCSIFGIIFKTLLLKAKFIAFNKFRSRCEYFFGLLEQSENGGRSESEDESIDFKWLNWVTPDISLSNFANPVVYLLFLTFTWWWYYHLW